MRRFAETIDSKADDVAESVAQDLTGLEAWLGKLSPFGFLLATTALLSGVFLLTLGLLSAPEDAVLSATAKSQILEVELDPGDEIPAFLSEQGELPFLEGCDAQERTFSITDPIETPIRITLSALPGGLVTALISPLEKQRFGVVYCGQQLIEIDREIAQEFPNFERDQSVVVINGGRIRLGSVPGKSFTPILLSGTVTASSPSFPFTSGRANEEVNVSLGDSIRFVNKQAGVDAPMQLVAFYNSSENLFDIAATSTSESGTPTELADTAWINRLGIKEPFEISRVPSAWARLEAQSEWALILVLVAIALNFLAAIRHYMDTRRS